jgi:hypothetical protein
MKKRELITIALVSLMLFSVFAAAPVSAELVCPSGMVSYWMFDEGSGTTAYDESAYNNDGTIYGASGTTGISGSALSFDGVDDYVNIPHSESLNQTDAITVEFWVKAASVQPTPDQHFLIIDKSHGWVDYTGWLFQSDWGKQKLLWGFGDGSTWDNLVVTTSIITDDTWHHIAGTFDGNEISVYVDGNLEAIKITTGTIATNTRAVNIGASWGGGTLKRFFKGLVDEVAIYNRALSPEEIQQHYENGLSGWGYCEVAVTIDFDPDTLNLKSNGEWITAYIELLEGYDVADIDVSTILLEDEIPAEAHPTEIGDHDNDGIDDLMVKFGRSAVQEILDEGEEVEITVTGELTDGTQFEGSDTIRVIDNGKSK